MPEISRLQIDQATRNVRINSAPVAIGARAFDVLVYLSCHSGRVVSKRELLDTVWGGLAVEEGNLSVQISTLRKALGPKVIATVPGVGYKLAVPEEELAASVPARAAPPLPAKPSLAVLPFSNLTGDPGNDDLVDGIVTELIGSLSRITCIFVSAATTYGHLSPDKTIAAQAVRQARAMAPNSGLVLNCAGWVLPYAGAYEEAIECFARTIRFDPLGPSTGNYRSGMGICPLLSGQVDAALVSLELGYAETPDFASAILRLMNAYHFLGRMEEAKALADKVLRLVPDCTISGNLAAQPFQLPAQRAFVERHAQGLRLPP